jgi:hypothetical protein
VNGLATVIVVIRSTLGTDSVGYIKSRHIARETDLSARQAGARLAYLRETDGAPVDVEPWSESGNSTTYRVTVADQTALDEYVERVEQSEPNLRPDL